MRSLSMLCIGIAVLFFSCSKKNGSGGTTNPPVNLVVNAIVNPDNSGNVAFTATAANAVSFDYDFGNGIFMSVSSGVITYKYPASGTYTVKVIAKSADGQTVSMSLAVTVTVVLTLSWSDEFETPGAPNPAKWGYDIGTGSGGWGNNELEYYTNKLQNAVVENGLLKIHAIKEDYIGSAYTSARLLTKDKFSFKYGKVEVKAKVPAGVGTWAAAWMLGSNIASVNWPACGEIDIMEHLGRDVNKIFGTLHYPGRSGGNADGNTKLISNATTEFHIYTLDWSESSIRLFVDNELYHTVVNFGGIPFNHDFFLIVNLAMGGNFGGNVDPALNKATLEVDYVRVYQ